MDAFQLGEDGMDTGDGAERLEDFGGGYEGDLNNEDMAPDMMQVGAEAQEQGRRSSAIQ